MTASEHLSPQFDNTARLAAFSKAKSRDGSEVFFGRAGDRYVPNPLAAHIPPPVIEHHDDGSTTSHGQSGLPSYSRTASVQRPRAIEQVPLHRLESTQFEVSRTHVNNMARRKGSAPPIEVTHHTNADRYVVVEGNHRAIVAMKKGQTHIPAVVTRITQH